MDENRRVRLKELAAGMIGERAEELLDFAVRAGGVTLISREGRKVQIGMEALERGRATQERTPGIPQRELGTEDSRPEKKARVKKGSGGGKP